VSPGPKSAPVPRMGDSPADTCKRADRMDSISNKLDWLIMSHTDVIRRLDALESKSSRARR
jgi:hypothetical protein